MEFSIATILIISVLFFIVAFLYSSVGHGGASGYLAVLSFFALAPKEMSSTALVLNIIVSGIAFTAYSRAGHFSPRLAFPFLVSSVPAAFVGGMIHIPASVYTFLLAVALFVAAFRLIVKVESTSGTSLPHTPPRIVIALVIGGVVGLLSGIVGIGGGIFLSPLILLWNWADAKQTSAVSACFILFNSVAGIAGRLTQAYFAVGSLLPFIVVAAAGGYLGSSWGARRFSNLTLRRLLGVVLIMAALKLLSVVL